MPTDPIPRVVRRVRTALALMAALAIGSATPIVALKPSPAHAQECSGTGGCSIRDVVESGAITLSAGTAGTATDPTWSRNHCTTTTCTPRTYVGLEGPRGVLGQTLGGTGVYTAPANGSASVDFSTGVVTYTPNPGFIGTDSFVVQTCEIVDIKCLGYTTTFSVTVAGPAAPSVSNASISTAFDTPGSVALPSSGVVSSFSISGAPAHGAAIVSGSTAIYTPDSGFYGSDSFTFSASGPGGTSNVATVTVSVGLPPAPVASNGSISTAYGTAGSTTLQASGVITSYAIAAGPAHGAVSVSGSTATYTPDAGFSGSDSFTFDVTGPGGTSAPATIAVTVLPPPAPVVVSNAAISTAYDTTGSVGLVSTVPPVTFTIASGPAHGAASLSGSTAIYSPNAGWIGSDSFTVYATGAGGRSNIATVSVTVAPPPAPVVSNGSISTAYNTTGTTALTVSGVVSTVAVASAPAHGVAGVSATGATYTPASGFVGTDSFTYVATGPGGTSNIGTITVTVAAPPAPVATGGSVTTPYNTPATVTLPGSGVITGYALNANPSHGSVSLSGASATYTPSAGYVGSDSFSYTVTGPGGVSSPGVISVTILAPPAPVANPGSLTCPYQTTCATTLTSTGLGGAYTLATQATNGTCSISGSTLTYVPAWGAVGADSCTFTVSGPGGTSAPATITITNEPPALPNPGGPTGTPIPTSGASTAICAAGQSASIPGLPGPPTGAVYDPNWCDEQVLTIAQQALRLANQQSQIAALQSQLAVQQKRVQGLGSDSTSAGLAQVNAKAQAILQQAAGIGFNAQAAGSTFAAAYPGGATVAGFNGAQLAAAMQAWQANTAQALRTSVAVQAEIAQSLGGVASSVQGAVNASSGAAGATAAHQATNQILAAVSTQLAQLQDILLAESQAYAALAAAKQQAAGAAAAVTAQTRNQTRTALTAAPGVTDTTHM